MIILNLPELLTQLFIYVAWWLEMDLILPFKVGDAVEIRSFRVGYRGAWFRCKVELVTS